MLETKNRFYEELFDGAGSETLSSMLGTLHALACAGFVASAALDGQVEGKHPRAARNADGAEALTRNEAQGAAAEAVRLIESGGGATAR